MTDTFGWTLIARGITKLQGRQLALQSPFRSGDTDTEQPRPQLVKEEMEALGGGSPLATPHLTGRTSPFTTYFIPSHVFGLGNFQRLPKSLPQGESPWSLMYPSSAISFQHLYSLEPVFPFELSPYPTSLLLSLYPTTSNLTIPPLPNLHFLHLHIH